MFDRVLNTLLVIMMTPKLSATSARSKIFQRKAFKHRNIVTS